MALFLTTTILNLLKSQNDITPENIQAIITKRTASPFMFEDWDDPADSRPVKKKPVKNKKPKTIKKLGTPIFLLLILPAWKTKVQFWFLNLNFL